MYEYEHQILINATASDVFKSYFDYEKYPLWQTSLKNVELVTGDWHEIGHEVNLHFKFNHQHMTMRESITSYHYPKQATVTYQMGSTFNIQRMKFIEKGKDCLWIVHTTFEFEQVPPTSIENFENSTLKSLETFKSYVESIKKGS